MQVLDVHLMDAYLFCVHYASTFGQTGVLTGFDLGPGDQRAAMLTYQSQRRSAPRILDCLPL